VVGVEHTSDVIMRNWTIALAFGFVLHSAVALAGTGHHRPDRPVVRTHRSPVGMVHLRPGYGDPDGPARFSGAGKNYAVPGWTNEETQYWIDNATGPKD
jgi:hypothetical protein